MSTTILLNLEQYKTQAKDLLKAAKLGEAQSLARVSTYFPAKAAEHQSLKLADAQLTIARENNFPSWPKFQQYILFQNAVHLLDTGDLSNLDLLLTKYKFVLSYRCHVGEWYDSGYFAGANLLNHIAGNPIRVPLPTNILEVTKLLLSHGAAKDISRTKYTIGLLLSSRQASEAFVALPLIDLLDQHCSLGTDLLSTETLHMPLTQSSPDTVQELIKRGAKIDIYSAAHLGMFELVEKLAPSSTPAEIDKACLGASWKNHPGIVEYLIDRGADPNADGGTGFGALHTAVHSGYLSCVRALLKNKPNLEVINRFGSTSLGLAIYSAINEPQPDHLAIIKELVLAGADVNPSWYETTSTDINSLLQRLKPKT